MGLRKAKFLGHPVHQMLIVFPLGLLARATCHGGDFRSYLSARRPRDDGHCIVLDDRGRYYRRAHRGALRMDRLVGNSARHTRQVDRPVARRSKRGRYPAVCGEAVRATRSTRAAQCGGISIFVYGSRARASYGLAGRRVGRSVGCRGGRRGRPNAPSSLSRRPIR